MNFAPKLHYYIPCNLANFDGYRSTKRDSDPNKKGPPFGGPSLSPTSAEAREAYW